MWILTSEMLFLIIIPGLCSLKHVLSLDFSIFRQRYCRLYDAFFTFQSEHTSLGESVEVFELIRRDDRSLWRLGDR